MGCCKPCVFLFAKLFEAGVSCPSCGFLKAFVLFPYFCGLYRENEKLNAKAFTELFNKTLVAVAFLAS